MGERLQISLRRSAFMRRGSPAFLEKSTTSRPAFCGERLLAAMRILSCGMSCISSREMPPLGRSFTTICGPFSPIGLSVSFNEETDEHITAMATFGDDSPLPLDAADGILQASQILSYVTLFKPELLILDEPDSHLHPNNQRALCSLIFELSQSRGFQAVMSTHSRHVLDAMRGRGSLVWLSKGSVVEHRTRSYEDVARHRRPRLDRLLR